MCGYKGEYGEEENVKEREGENERCGGMEDEGEGRGKWSIKKWGNGG